jgi:hypothetical protein
VPHVTIDGIDYVPAGHAPHLGIAITTHDRPDVLEKCLTQHLKHLPTGAHIVVIDDGSTIPATVPDGVHLHRFEESRGIVAAKNASLELLMEAGAEYLSLWDDDAYPIADGWEKPYIESPEGHLAYQFLDLSGTRKLGDTTILWEDDQHVAHSGQRGVMLWYRRNVIEDVGGFDPVYGRGMYEHSDLANRIFERGHTTFRYMDVQGSSVLIHSMDEHEEVERSVPRRDREQQVATNADTHNRRREHRYAGWAPYRRMRNVVLTSLLTSEVDPQRGTRMTSDYEALRTLHESIPTGELTVFHDSVLAGAPDDLSTVRVAASGMNPYFSRWVHAHTYLRDHTDVEYAIICDGTDVEFLADPFPHLERGTIIVGDEHQVVGCQWMRDNHDHPRIREFINAHANSQLLNAGVVAGHRQDLLPFLREIIAQWQDMETDRFHGKAGEQVGDMGIFNLVAHTWERANVVHGPRWTSPFKAEARPGHSLIKHK